MPRLNLKEVAPDLYQHYAGLNADLHKGPVDDLLLHLIKARASQINGCVYCIDLHIHDAKKLGETENRIYQLSAWRESELFTDAERAVLAYTEEATRLGEHGVSDETWDAVTKEFTEEQTAHIVFAVTLINALNRIGVPLRMRPPRRS